MSFKQHILSALLLLLATTAGAVERQKLNFNQQWLLELGDNNQASQADFDDSRWHRVTLPHAWNEAEAFRVPIDQLSDTTMWYRKHFNLTNIKGKNYFVEFEGVRFGAEVFINGHSVGLTENGVMASGFDLTPYIKEGDNVLAVWVDNSWNYRERATNQKYQWNNKNFNANYGGIPKNVWLHVTGKLYQTLPLYSNLGTTGVYIYGKDYDIAGKKVTVHAESQVANSDDAPHTFCLETTLLDADGKEVGKWRSENITLQARQSTTAAVEGLLENAHFWSWGYGYLYTVKMQLKNEKNETVDEQTLRTGFRKFEFGEGKMWLNDRVIMMHGYAQRTSNEWPGVGIDVPAWLSDYSNTLLVESGGNLVRWMHVTPSKQDVESCDRSGLIQAMPAGDAEKDCSGRQWEQRVALMRDAIIYNRNNPSILFYEGGNESISREHMIELRKLRDEYDPCGGRAIGSREMLDIDEAEYGGEMLYINKSGQKPYWQMEYNRDEGLRKYWDEYSYPFHKEGAGPLYRDAPAPDYNHNMDRFACTMVERWYDYFQDRPGMGKRVSGGGTKIVFSDTNTHYRGESNYRTSGVTDAVRVPKDAFYVHQVMWDGWVTPERDKTHIIGHWNYDKNVVKPVYVVSTGDDVELFVNGKSVGHGERSYQYLYTFKDVAFEPGTLEAVASTNGQETSRHKLETAGKADHLQVKVISNPEGFKADGADLALVEFDVVDAQGRRCPLDNRMVNFNLSGEGQWIGGIARPIGPCTNDYSAEPANKANGKEGMLDGPASTSEFDNYIRALSLPVECGVNRVLLRSTTTPGTITLSAIADGLRPVVIDLQTEALTVENGTSNYNPSLTLPLNLSRGETPQGPSYKDLYSTIEVKSIKADDNEAEAWKSCDDNELSEWKSNGEKDNAWIRYTFKEKAKVDLVTIKLTGWRNKIYPLAIYAGKKKVWEGFTYATLGYVHIDLPESVKAKDLTIKMLGPVQNNDKFGKLKELAGGATGELDRVAEAKGKTELRIVEVDFLQKID